MSAKGATLAQTGARTRPHPTRKAGMPGKVIKTASSAWVIYALQTISEQLDELNTKFDTFSQQLTEGITMAEDTLQTSFDALSATVDEAIAAGAAAAAQIQALAEQISSITPNTTLTPADIQGLADKLTTVTQTLTDAVAGSQGAQAPPA